MPSLPPLGRSITAPRILAYMRHWHLQVRLDTDARFTQAAVTAAFSGAEELEIECWQAMYGAADPGAVLGRFSGVRGVKRCVVKGSIGPAWRERIEKSVMRPAKKEQQVSCEDCGCSHVHGTDEEDEQQEWDWGVVEKDMFGGQRMYELWEHGGR